MPEIDIAKLEERTKPDEIIFNATKMAIECRKDSDFELTFDIDNICVADDFGRQRQMRGASVSCHMADVLLSVRVTQRCRLWASVESTLKRPCLPDRFIGEIDPDMGSVLLLIPLVALPHDRLLIEMVQDETVESPTRHRITVGLRVIAEEQRCAQLAFRLTQLKLLGAEYETRGGFIFPKRWSPGQFHGLGYGYGRAAHVSSSHFKS